jgi:hypothetical protein
MALIKSLCGSRELDKERFKKLKTTCWTGSFCLALIDCTSRSVDAILERGMTPSKTTFW